MTDNLAFAPMPRPWSVTGSPSGRRLRIGAREIALDDVASVAVEQVTARDVQGLGVMTAVFAMAAALILIGVADLGWQTRFLIGAAVLAGLALASLSEIFGVRSIAYTRLHIRSRRGATLLFTSADAREVDALAEALGLGPDAASGHRKIPATGAPVLE